MHIKVAAKSFRPPAGAPTFTLKKLQKLTISFENSLNYFYTSFLYKLLSFMLSYSNEYDNEQHHASYPVSEADDEWIHSTATEKVVS